MSTQPSSTQATERAPAGTTSTGSTASTSNTTSTEAPQSGASGSGPTVTGAPACPKCGGRMWDNRQSKRNPRAPDFKCRDRRCDGVLWPGQHKAAEPIIAPRRLTTESTADDTTAAPEGDETTTGDSERQEDQGQDRAAPFVHRAQSHREEQGTGDAHAVRSILRQRYLDLTDFALREVRPKYRAAGVPFTGQTVAAIVATLMEETRKRQTRRRRTSNQTSSRTSDQTRSAGREGR